MTVDIYVTVDCSCCGLQHPAKLSPTQPGTTTSSPAWSLDNITYDDSWLLK